jgi:hypothetical protein
MYHSALQGTVATVPCNALCDFFIDSMYSLFYFIY